MPGKKKWLLVHFPRSATHARKCNFRRGVFKFLMSEDKTIKKSPFCENPNGFIFKLNCFVAAESKWLRGDFDSIQKSHHFELTSKWVEVSLWWASKTVTNGRLDTREVRTAVGVIKTRLCRSSSPPSYLPVSLPRQVGYHITRMFLKCMVPFFISYNFFYFINILHGFGSKIGCHPRMCKAWPSFE